MFFFLLFLKLGPALLKALRGQSLLEIQGDIFSFGGADAHYNSAIYQLSCSSGICSWVTLNQVLKIARYYTVAISVPDSFCLEEGGDTTSPSITTTSGACIGDQSWIGDGYCDDSHNNIGCNFDGGDCCGSNVNAQYCIECICLA